MMKNHLSRILSALVLFAIGLAGLPPAATAQTAAINVKSGLATIEEKVEARRKELGIPGMSLAIVKDGEVVYSKGLGYKDFENKVPVTPDTQFAIGSSTKAFTGLSVLMTADEGKLSLDASPKTVLPYFKMADPDTDKNMTIRDLLTHSSGLNRTDLAMITGKLSRQELIRVAGEAKPIAKLRETFGYQNVMYAAAGEVVAVAQKKPWEKFVPERIFKPLGMTNSNMSVAEMEKAKDRSFGYVYNFDTKETKKLPYRPIDDIAPAGSINSSANDMARWIQFVLSRGTVNGKRLVSEKAYAEWLKPQMSRSRNGANGKFNYGLGWFLESWNGLTVVLHGGNIDGFNALVAMVPEKNVGFVMLTNVSGSSLGGELMPIVWENMIGKPPITEPVAEVPIEKEVGQYNFAAAGFDIDVQLKEGKLQAVVPGQPTYTLERVAGRKYKLGGAPDGFFVTFKDSELFLEQPQGNYTLPRKGGSASAVDVKKEPETPKFPLTADELMAKAIEASGGEANWRKLSSRVTESEVDLLHQGVKATATSWSKAPNFTATETTMTAIGKKIAVGWEYFDGKTSEEAYSFSPATKHAGKRLEDIKLGSDFYGMLDWKSKYKSVKIEKTGKCGEDEECYFVVFEPEKGSKFTEGFSTTTYLLKQRNGTIPSSTNSVEIPYSVKFDDYREVDGVKLPFKQITTNPGQGEIVTVVKSVKHNVPIEDSMFKARDVKF